MALLSVMRESLRLLLREPKMFLPNMIVSLMYAAFELSLLKISIDLFGDINALTAEHLQDMLSSNISALLWIIALYPFLAVVDLISYAMYPSMVLDYHHRRDISLRRAMSSALKAWKTWLSLGLVILLFVVCITPLVSGLYILYYLTGNYIFFLVGVFVFLGAIILFMLSVFFVMPIGVIEKREPLRVSGKATKWAARTEKKCPPSYSSPLP